VRSRRSKGGLTVRAIAGTHTVLLGMDLREPAGCLGFAVHRTDHTEGEAAWLRGMKTFPSVLPNPPPGSDYSTRDHPIQSFQWGDYSAKPEHDYTYAVSAMGGAPGALAPLATTAVRVRTETEDDGVHGVWFNRGVAGSQAFARRFPDFVPGPDPDESHPAMRWLSRGLGEAFLAFCAEALGPGWGLRGAFYEFTWGAGLSALAAARDRGVDLQLVVHGRDRDVQPGKDDDRTAAQARVAALKYGLDVEGVLHWRAAANKSALQHNKFLVLLRDGVPVAVWTGSTNLTRGGIYGHSNVAHLIRDRAVAAAFHAEWQDLAAQRTTVELRAVHEGGQPVNQVVPAASGTGIVFSPRATTSTLLPWYARVFDSGAQSAHITGAFGLHAVFRQTLGVARPEAMRTVLLEKVPPRAAAIPRVDPNVRISTGSHLASGNLEHWAEEFLTGFNTHVKYIHTKIILVDPMTDDPTVITGSANYSDNSTTTNEENTVVIRSGRTRASSRRAVKRVADIYLTEYHRLFMHFAFRAMSQGRTLNEGTRQWTGHLESDDGWALRYYRPGSWRALQRRLYSGG
jgi:phosphatidylserine/phosphatidylglycerophosphate/cardiolipin synthase-like enzyme